MRVKALIKKASGMLAKEMAFFYVGTPDFLPWWEEVCYAKRYTNLNAGNYTKSKNK